MKLVFAAQIVVLATATSIEKYYRDMVVNDVACLGMAPVSDEKYLANLNSLVATVPGNVRRAVLNEEESKEDEDEVETVVQLFVPEWDPIHREAAQLNSLQIRLANSRDGAEVGNIAVGGLYSVWTEMNCVLDPPSRTGASAIWHEVLDETLRRSAEMVSEGETDRLREISTFVIPVLLQSSRGDPNGAPRVEAILRGGPMARGANVGSVPQEVQDRAVDLGWDLFECCVRKWCLSTPTPDPPVTSPTPPTPAAASASPKFAEFVTDALTRLQGVMLDVAMTEVNPNESLDSVLSRLRNAHLKDISDLLRKLAINAPVSFQADPSEAALLRVFDLLMNNTSGQPWAAVKSEMLQQINKLQQQFTNAKLASQTTP